MAKSRRHLLLIIAGSGVLAIGIGATSFWYFRLRPWFILEKARYGNMMDIVFGVSEYVTDRREMPTDLEDVVREGFLPEHSAIYRCPLLHNSLGDESIPYTACEYEIRFGPDEVIVRLPRAAIDEFALSTVPVHLVECRVNSSGHIVLPASPSAEPKEPNE